MVEGRDIPAMKALSYPWHGIDSEASVVKVKAALDDELEARKAMAKISRMLGCNGPDTPREPTHLRTLGNAISGLKICGANRWWTAGHFFTSAVFCFGPKAFRTIWFLWPVVLPLPPIRESISAFMLGSMALS